jgi:cell division protease FtsH
VKKEIIIGAGAALFLFLVKQGLDPVPFFLLAGAMGALHYYLRNRGLEKNFETLEYKGEKEFISHVSFADIGGQETAKRELVEALDFLREEERTKALGIRPLKGILLTGPPGTGKTLMAKAAAHYMDSVFMAASGSEFIEMYAGVGAQRVRQLFSRARRLAQKMGKNRAVIFLDELEVLGGKRGKHTSHLEYDQTLNQLLVEMDGLRAEDGVRVLVIGATNRADLLDEALLRPGRFDRRVQVDLPAKEGRRKILEIHTKNKPLAHGVDLERVARDTFGFSGAHLESLVNEAAILSFRKGKQEISLEEMEEALDKVLLGERTDKQLRLEELERVAIHETGHALVSETLRPKSVRTLTIIPRGRALGFMRPAGEEERSLYTKKYMEEQIAICLGGAVAEEVIYGERSTGAANDLEQAARLARDMITTGLSSLGVVDEDCTPQKKIYREFQKIMTSQVERATTIIEAKKDHLQQAAVVLLAEEKISGAKLRQLLKMDPEPAATRTSA